LAIHLKQADQIEKMYRAGQIVREVLDRLGEMIAPDMTTKDLDDEAERLCLSHGATCLFKGVPGRGGAGPYPGNICASLNDEVVHGIPSENRPVRSGDILSVDFGVLLDGWCGDAARTYCVGDVAPRTVELVEATRDALELAISMMAPGVGWSKVAGAMSDYLNGKGFSVVEEFVGHGIGKNMHEDPKVPNYVSPELRVRDIRLRPGLVLAVEPMVNLGEKGVRMARDGWTVLTLDGKPSAHWEHTVAITDDGVRVLTR
jgi:methionyl aminopeptidase